MKKRKNSCPCKYAKTETVCFFSETVGAFYIKFVQASSLLEGKCVFQKSVVLPSDVNMVINNFGKFPWLIFGNFYL